MSAVTLSDQPPPSLSRRARWLRKHPTLIVGALLLLAVTLLSLAAPWLASHDPQEIDPMARLQGSSAEHWLGTDAMGRDVFSRALWGGQVSLQVGLTVAVLSTVLGVLLGLIAGFVRWADGPVMRVMDGMMAIPGILLAIALMAVTRASMTTVIVAIIETADEDGAGHRVWLARVGDTSGWLLRRFDASATGQVAEGPAPEPEPAEKDDEVAAVMSIESSIETVIETEPEPVPQGRWSSWTGRTSSRWVPIPLAMRCANCLACRSQAVAMAIWKSACVAWTRRPPES